MEDAGESGKQDADQTDHEHAQHEQILDGVLSELVLEKTADKVNHTNFPGRCRVRTGFCPRPDPASLAAAELRKYAVNGAAHGIYKVTRES